MQLYYEDSGGTAPPLLLIAGLASDADSWTLQKDALASRHRLILFDNPGMARSPRSSSDIAGTAVQVIQLLDHLGIASVSLLGHSMGGAIAQHLALSYPERVDRLILACSFSRLERRSLTVAESWARVLALGADAQTLSYCLFPWLHTESFLAKPGHLEGCVQALEDHPYRLDPEVVAAQVAALREFDSDSLLDQIAAPTLVLGAEEDLLVSLESSRKLARAIPGALLRTLPRSGHSCMLETPELFNQAVLDFTAPPDR